jgi:hypothetical protein
MNIQAYVFIGSFSFQIKKLGNCQVCYLVGDGKAQKDNPLLEE